MPTSVPSAFFVDLSDVAVAAAIWERARWTAPGWAQIVREGVGGLALPEDMGGWEEVDEFLELFVYDEALVRLLSYQSSLAHVSPAFWAALAGVGFTGAFSARPDGERIVGGTVVAELTGDIGMVLLYRAGVTRSSAT